MNMFRISNALLVASLLPVAAQAQVVASDPKALAMGVAQAGYLAKIETDSLGDPKITTKMSGWKVDIFFYGCTDNKDCQSIQLRTGFDRESPMDLAQVNSWNAKRRFGAISLDDEGDPYISWDIILNEPISQAVFAQIVDVYDEAVGDFGLIAFNDQAEKEVESGSETKKGDSDS